MAMPELKGISPAGEVKLKFDAVPEYVRLAPAVTRHKETINPATDTWGQMTEIAEKLKAEGEKVTIHLVHKTWKFTYKGYAHKSRPRIKPAAEDSKSSHTERS